MKTCPTCNGTGIVESCPTENTCNWMIQGRNKWTCSHGVVVTIHPNGWCDGGCCR